VKARKQEKKNIPKQKSPSSHSYAMRLVLNKSVTTVPPLVVNFTSWGNVVTTLRFQGKIVIGRSQLSVL